MSTYSVRYSENLIGLVWFGPPSMAGVTELETAFKQVSLHPGKIGFATRVTPEALADGASADIRKKIGQLLNRYRDRIGGTVVIFEGTGLKATLVRTIVGAINLVSSSHFPSEVHSSLLRGCIWLVRQLGEDAPTDGETRLMELLPARYKAGMATSGPLVKAS